MKRGQRDPRGHPLALQYGQAEPEAVGRTLQGPPAQLLVSFGQPPVAALGCRFTGCHFWGFALGRGQRSTERGCTTTPKRSLMASTRSSDRSDGVRNRRLAREFDDLGGQLVGPRGSGRARPSGSRAAAAS